MKFSFCLFPCIFFLTVNCFSQDAAIDFFHINKLPREGILLDRGWKFQVGDNLEWATPQYDDSKWASINPALDIHDSLPQIPRSGIVWFRLRLLIDSTATNELAMMIQQSGASEMYLNGKLIHRFGVLSTKPEEVTAYNPLDKPVSFPVINAGMQTLAIRYALQPHIFYSNHWGFENRGLHLTLNTLENAIDEYKWFYITIESHTLKVGVFGILGILYLAFYVFYPTQKINLYFSLYALLQAVWWSVVIYLNNQPLIEQFFLINNFLLVLFVAAYYFLLTGVYNLLDQKKGWIYYSLIALSVISIPFGVFIYGWGWKVFGFLFTNLMNFDITRIAIKAIRNKKKGAWIIATGGIGFLIFWLLVSTQSLGYSVIYFFTLAFFSIPVAVSIYLGYDFALTNRTLQQKLAEVESLSVEKQQILFSQNETLEKQVTQRTFELQNSLKELKETQSQLVQREKMASLGELTAGIAHEIQNPLNFINNFSEINTELIDELKSEKSKLKSEEFDELLNDIAKNEQKINHHGKRADAIVKGMLQHSHANSGQKEPTDINALADEYLRLSYHGLRAKNKDFNADFKTDFDESIGRIEVVPQDIGRVLLNLYNNALYAVNEKKRQLNGTFEPTVIVTTKKTGNKVEIVVKDNGDGIPQKVIDKIFQPFFTTKPTGQGTGLGLSLSYDIVKTHQGEIKVDSIEGEGCEFTVRLPG
jgi:two-component system NtrC family sensor kinase